MTNNSELAQKYDSVYKEGSSKFYSFNTYPESRAILDMLPSWIGLDVLEIGCGEGRLAAMMSFAGARHVDAVDYSAEAIKLAKERLHLDNVTYSCADHASITKRYDVVVMQGVLEHMDRPFELLEGFLTRNLSETGFLITSSPSFLNPRGYVWMTLQLLFGVPMSLTDLHFLCPYDFQTFAREHGYALEIKSTEQEWGAGERMLIDFRKRLPNALRDAGMDGSGVERLLEWLEKAAPYHLRDEFSGATIVYKINTGSDLTPKV